MADLNIWWTWTQSYLLSESTFSPPHLPNYFWLNFQSLTFLLTSPQRLWLEDSLSVSVIKKSLSIYVNIRRQIARRGARRMTTSRKKKLFRLVVLRLEWASESPGGSGWNTNCWVPPWKIQWLWGGNWKYEFLPASQVVLMLLVHDDTLRSTGGFKRCEGNKNGKDIGPES